MPPSLSDALAAHARRAPDALAVDHPAAHWTWSELAARVRATTERLTSCAPGERVLVQASDIPSVLPLLLAERARVCVVPLAADLPPAERARRQQAALLHIGPAPGLLVFTSGTTGRARAARLPLPALLRSARRVIDATALGPDDRWLSSLPLSHVGGVGVVLRCVLAGATMVLRDRFDPTETAQLLRSGVTHGSFVARMLDRTLAVSPGPYPPSLRVLMVGGGPTPPPLLARARAAGLPALATYGMTEAGSTLTLERPADLIPPSAGSPLPGVQLRIGHDSVIEVLTDSAMEGYDPPDDSPVVDGWLRTSDVGALLPDGRLVVLDRRSDIIVTGGENVAPARLEALIGEDPAVTEVAVVGLPDPSWGQRVVAVICLAPGASLEDVETRVRPHLAPHERPKQWVVQASPLPRDGVGKLLRAQVRAALLPLSARRGTSSSAR